MMIVIKIKKMKVILKNKSSYAKKNIYWSLFAKQIKSVKFCREYYTLLLILQKLSVTALGTRA